MLGSLLLNIDLNVLLVECEDGNITSYANDTAHYFCGQDISSVIFELQRIAKKIFHWCKKNHMKAIPGK